MHATSITAFLPWEGKKWSLRRPYWPGKNVAFQNTGDWMEKQNVICCLTLSQCSCVDPRMTAWIHIQRSHGGARVTRAGPSGNLHCGTKLLTRTLDSQPDKWQSTGLSDVAQFQPCHQYMLTQSIGNVYDLLRIPVFFSHWPSTWQTWSNSRVYKSLLPTQ